MNKPGLFNNGNKLFLTEMREKLRSLMLKIVHRSDMHLSLKLLEFSNYK